jgi:hypothetical protein
VRCLDHALDRPVVSLFEVPPTASAGRPSVDPGTHLAPHPRATRQSDALPRTGLPFTGLPRTGLPALACPAPAARVVEDGGSGRRIASGRGHADADWAA